MIYYVLIISSTILVSFVIYLVYYSNAHWTSKFLAVPISIFVAIWLSVTFISFSGIPITTYPEGEWVYIHHRITPNGQFIYLWVTHGPYDDRLYKIPYVRETARRLGEAVAKKDEMGVGNTGQSVTVGEFDGHGRNDRNLMVRSDNVFSDNNSKIENE